MRSLEGRSIPTTASDMEGKEIFHASSPVNHRRLSTVNQTELTKQGWRPPLNLFHPQALSKSASRNASCIYIYILLLARWKEQNGNKSGSLLLVKNLISPPFHSIICVSLSTCLTSAPRFLPLLPFRNQSFRFSQGHVPIFRQL